MNKVIKLIVLILVIFEIIFSYLTFKSFANKPSEKINKIEISTTEKIDNNNSFAIMLEGNNGDFVESSDRSGWPSSPYQYGGVECYDEFGEVSDTVTSFDETSKKLTLTTRKSVFCYIKFAKSAAGLIISRSGSKIETDANMKARGDNLRRIQGQAEDVTNNYICLGSTTECDLTNATNSDKYSYRIIGVVREANAGTGEQVGQIKVIKTEAVNSISWGSEWNSTTWSNCSIKENINDYYFLTNETYGLTGNVGSTGKSWNGLITNHTWKYSYVPGLNFSTGLRESMSGLEVYNKEKELWNSGTNAGSSINKIGLMYAHDYILATQDGNDKKCVGSSNDYEICKGNWIYLWGTNDSSAPNQYFEWTMTQADERNVWFVVDNGYVSGGGSSNISNYYAYRPVFYLQSTVQITGKGTKQEPFIVATY